MRGCFYCNKRKCVLYFPLIAAGEVLCKAAVVSRYGKAAGICISARAQTKSER